MNPYNHQPKAFHNLMDCKIREILLVSNQYTIFNFVEDGNLTGRLINEYKGLNFSSPPRITGVTSDSEALSQLCEKKFDMVIIIPQPQASGIFSLAKEIKQIKSDTPIFLLTGGMSPLLSSLGNGSGNFIDYHFIWSGNSHLLLSMVKLAEDQLKVKFDSPCPNARIILLVEDSPDYYSYILPVIHKKIITLTQALMDRCIDEKERIAMSGIHHRILLATTYDEAKTIYKKYKSSLLGVISDTRLPHKGKPDATAGLKFLSRIKKEMKWLPVILTSSEPENREKAKSVGAWFIDKNSSCFLQETSCFLSSFGLGEFIFRMPDNTEISRASTLPEFEYRLSEIPEESLAQHMAKNHFVPWLMAHSEISLAEKILSIRLSDFRSIKELRHYMVSNIRALRKSRKKGIVSRFDKDHFDPEIDPFTKIGSGSLGGKARGLAFISGLLQHLETLQLKYPGINVTVPKTLVICADVFERFVRDNSLQDFTSQKSSNEKIAEVFINGKMPSWLVKDLACWLKIMACPLIVRASSQLEDNYINPSMGLYQSYILSNDHPDPDERLLQLIHSIKRVYASVYFKNAKAFSKNIANQQFHESISVIIQQLTGDVHGDYFYPALSGIAQSFNFYPFSPMKSEDGIAHMALGFGKTITLGEKSLRFSPKYQEILPQFSSVQDILNNSQSTFYALKLNSRHEFPGEGPMLQTLEKREVLDAMGEFPVKALTSSYIVEENRIRDTWHAQSPPVITFSRILKNKSPNIPGLLSDLLEIFANGIGGPVEIEFAVNLSPDDHHRADFYILQARPMPVRGPCQNINLTEDDLKNAVCRSSQALGNGVNEEMADIVFVKPEDFSKDATVCIAEEINKINACLLKEKRPYLLVGPGRWGASDRWLGVPVKWRNISGARAIVELINEKLNVNPSQGSHFFHNITSLGIQYITVHDTHPPGGREMDYFDWKWISTLQPFTESRFIRHVRLKKPLLMKIDGRKSQCVLLTRA